MTFDSPEIRPRYRAHDLHLVPRCLEQEGKGRGKSPTEPRSTPCATVQPFNLSGLLLRLLSSIVPSWRCSSSDGRTGWGDGGANRTVFRLSHHFVMFHVFLRFRAFDSRFRFPNTAVFAVFTVFLDLTRCLSLCTLSPLGSRIVGAPEGLGPKGQRASNMC